MLSLLYGPTLISYMTTGKIIALTIRTFVCKEMPFPFNTLSGFLIAFFPRNDRRISSVQLLSRVWLFATPWIAAGQDSLSITNPQSLLKLLFMESVMPPNHLILYHPLFLLPSIFPSIRVFSNESVLRIRWLKYWSFSFSSNPSHEYSGLISLRIDWLGLPAIQGTLKRLL